MFSSAFQSKIDLLRYFGKIEESIARDSVFCAGSVGNIRLASYRDEDVISGVRNPANRYGAMVWKILILHRLMISMVSRFTEKSPVAFNNFYV